MELNYNFYALIETVGFVQAITLGSLLIILNKNKYKSTFFLGLFLVLFGLETIPIILTSLDAYKIYSFLYLLPFDFFWLHFPVFLLYAFNVSIFCERKKPFWVLYPGIIMFLVQLIVFFLPYETKLLITESSWYDLYMYTKIAYGLGIGIWTLLLLEKHIHAVNNYFATVDFKELRWARIFLIYNISGSILYSIFANTIPESMTAKVFFAMFDLILIYWVSYHGVEQRNVLSLLNRQKNSELSNTELVDDKTRSSDGNQDMEELMQTINQYMISSESFVHGELTIIDIAERIRIHPKRISTAINTISGQNFNTYINRFRIKKAKGLLADTASHNLSIEGIGHEVGFHSKSAFYSAFKKETGTTPSKYKERTAA